MGRISMPQGRGSQLHNRRDYSSIGREMPNNIDVCRTHENITLIDVDVRTAYETIFGEAVAEYNEKQKRADRKIKDYLDHIARSKNGEKIFYEDVVQWGKMEDFQNPYIREAAKEALVRYAAGFQERNPNLRVIGAYVHMDEASPHLHLDYIPVAHGYKQGMKLRNSLDRAMKEMGFVPENESRRDNATMLWKARERNCFAEICRNMGLTVEAERTARGSFSVDEYKEARDTMMGNIENERDYVAGQVNALANAARKLSDPERTDPVEVAGRMFTPVPELVRRSEKAAEELKGIEDMIEQQKGALERMREEINRFLQYVGELFNKMISGFKKGIDEHEPAIVEEAREEFNQDYLFAPLDERVKNAYKESVMANADELKGHALKKIQERDL